MSGGPPVNHNLSSVVFPLAQIRCVVHVDNCSERLN